MTSRRPAPWPAGPPGSLTSSRSWRSWSRRSAPSVVPADVDERRDRGVGGLGGGRGGGRRDGHVEDVAVGRGGHRQVLAGRRRRSCRARPPTAPQHLAGCCSSWASVSMLTSGGTSSVVERRDVHGDRRERDRRGRRVGRRLHAATRRSRPAARRTMSTAISDAVPAHEPRVVRPAAAAPGGSVRTAMRAPVRASRPGPRSWLLKCSRSRARVAAGIGELGRPFHRSKRSGSTGGRPRKSSTPAVGRPRAARRTTRSRSRGSARPGSSRRSRLSCSAYWPRRT